MAYVKMLDIYVIPVKRDAIVIRARYLRRVNTHKTSTLPTCCQKTAMKKNKNGFYPVLIFMVAVKIPSPVKMTGLRGIPDGLTAIFLSNLLIVEQVIFCKIHRISNFRTH